MTKNLL